MNRSAVAAPVVALAVVGAFLVGGRGGHPAVAEDAASSGTSGVVVDGLGKVSGTPDVLRVTMGVSVTKADVSAALNAANAAENQVRKALSKSGVATGDLQTSDVSIYPSFDNKGKKNGYQVNETLTAKLTHLDKAGRAISDAVEAGGNVVVLQGVSFSLEDNKALLQQARDAAFADARGKAESYADLAHRSLGKVELVTESTSAPLPVYASAGKTFDSASSAVPIDAGSQQVSVSVTVRWALG